MIKYTFDYCKNNGVAIEIKSEEDFQKVKLITKQLLDKTFAGFYNPNPEDEYNRVAVSCSTGWCSVAYFERTGWKIISTERFVNDNFIMPEKWDIVATPETVDVIAKWFDENWGCSGDKYFYQQERRIQRYRYGIYPGNVLWPTPDKDYPEITFEQFKKYILKQEETENIMSKKIIGYKIKDAFKQYEPEAFNIAGGVETRSQWSFEDGYQFTYTSKNAQALRKAGILDLWFDEVCEEEYKVGDWVIGWSSSGSPVIKLLEEKKDGFVSNFTSLYNSANQYITFNNIQRRATEEEIKEHLVKEAEKRGFNYGVEFQAVRNTSIKDLYAGGLTPTCSYSAQKAKCSNVEDFCYNPKTDTLTTYGFGLYVVYENGVWATIRPTEKVMSVGGKFNVTIKDGKIYHKSDDITDFVQDIKSFVDNIPTKLGNNYDFIVDSNNIVITKSGCQNHNVTIKDWLDIYKQI